MAQKNKALGDEEIVVLADQESRQCVGFNDSKLAKERLNVMKYYNSELPARAAPGRSSYVSSDVYDAVESMCAQLLETFAANTDNLVTFPARNAQDVDAAQEATEYVNHVVFEQNNGYQLFHDVIHNGLMARIGVAKVYWDKIIEETEHTITNASYEQVMGLSAQPDIDDLDASQDDKTGMFNGTFMRKEDHSKVTIEGVAPEEFRISSRARSIEAAQYCEHVCMKTRAELLDMGLDKKKVDALSFGSDKSTEAGQEAIERNLLVESSTGDDNAVQPEQQKLTLHEGYMRFDKRDGKGTRLYKLLYVDNVLFECDEVDRAPFKVFVPLPIPHLFFGNNFADRVKATQNARTVLTRAILDHAAMTTNPRWQVLKGGLLNPKEMLDNRLGGLVNINRPDAITPLAQQNLNPFVFSTLEMLKANKEESTGISALSQGLNKDAISTQNSAALVDNLVTLSQGRQKIIARNFAYGFLIPLYLEVYRLVLENEKQEKVIEVAGNWKRIDVSSWTDRRACKVALHLGYGEKDREVAKYANAYQMIAKDPALAPGFTYEERHALVIDGMRVAGFANFAKYLKDPKAIQAPQPDPLKVQELQIKNKQADAALTAAHSDAVKNTKQLAISYSKEQLNELKLHLDHLLKVRAEDRKDAESANKIDVAQRETKLLEEAPPAAEKAIVSPS